MSSSNDNDGLLKDIAKVDFNDSNPEIPMNGTLVDAGYPLYKKMATIDETSFKALVNSFTHVLKKKHDGKYDKHKLYILEDWWKNLALNCVTDLFTEDCRIKCKLNNDITPLEYWEKHKNEMLMKTVDIMKLRELLYYTTTLCSNFRVSVAITILRIFKVKRWLDLSAGWGDRLVAAIGGNVDYYFATDPNLCLRDKYKDIINTLASEKDREKFVVENRGFEHVVLPSNKRFDMCFSSPPSYTMEIYSNSPEDSISRYKSEEEWYSKFLIYSIRKAINVLAIGGHLIIHLHNTEPTSTYLIKMVDNVSKYLKYKGIIYYYYHLDPNAKLMGMYVWKKLYDENPNFIIQRYENIDIIRDDLLESGSKQRAVISIIRKLSDKYNEFVVPTSEYGIGGLTLAYACKLFQKVAHIFVTDSSKMYPEIKAKIEKYGGIIHTGFRSMKEIYSNIESFKEGKNIYEFQLGFEGELFAKTLEKKLKFALGTTFVYQWITRYDEVWIVGGTGSMSKILFNIFANSKIFVVQVGKEIVDTIKDPRYKIIKYNKPFSYRSEVVPPFNSIPNYDAKAWEMLIKSNRANKNILFWNVYGV